VIDRIIQFAARNGSSSFSSSFAIAGSGYWRCADADRRDPGLSDVQVIIMTDWSGRSPTWSRTSYLSDRPHRCYRAEGQGCRVLVLDVSSCT